MSVVIDTYSVNKSRHKYMATTWPQHGHNMATTWPQHGHNMVTTWPQTWPHTWPQHGHNMATTWPQQWPQHDHNMVTTMDTQSATSSPLDHHVDSPPKQTLVESTCCIFKSDTTTNTTGDVRCDPFIGGPETGCGIESQLNIRWKKTTPGIEQGKLHPV